MQAPSQVVADILPGRSRVRRDLARKVSLAHAGHVVDPGRLIRRRTFIGVAAAGLAGTAAGLSGCDGPGSAPPRSRGRLDDVKHVVVLMQENRSFDHYFGTMRGVRGLSDRAALRLANGRDIFHQPDPQRPDGGYLLPFHVDTGRVDGQDLGDLDHSWDGTHLAWNGGHNDGWVAAKTALTMSYFTRADVPFHRALAEAFTVCDNYFCSVQGPTTPNRCTCGRGRSIRTASPVAR
jgi:phospholipase C